MHCALDMQELPLKGPQELHGIIYALAEIIRQGIYQVVYELAEFFEQISLFWRHCLFFEARQTVVAPTQSALVRDTACIFSLGNRQIYQKAVRHSAIIKPDYHRSCLYRSL